MQENLVEKMMAEVMEKLKEKIIVQDVFHLKKNAV